MRILSVPQLHPVRQYYSCVFAITQPFRDHGIICCGVEENFRCKFFPELLGRLPFRLNLTEHTLVIQRIGNDRHALAILRCTPEERWPSDINLLDRFLLTHFFCHSLCKRIEIHNDEIDGGNAELLCFLYMRRVLTPEEHPSEQERMHRLHTTREAFGKFRDIFDESHLYSCCGKSFRSPSCGENLNAFLL